MNKFKNCFRSQGGAAMEINNQGLSDKKQKELKMYSMLMTEAAPPRIESSHHDIRQKLVYSD